MCAAYAPRDPIAEFWRGEITLRMLRVLIQGLPAGNVWQTACTHNPWTDREYLLHDIGDAIRDLTLMVANSNPYRKTPVGEEAIRPRIPYPDAPQPTIDDNDAESRAARDELDALIGSMSVGK